MILRTQRLTLRSDWHDGDLEALAAMNADPEVMRYIAAGDTQDRERTAAFLARVRAGWESHGYGLFAVTPHGADELIGWAGLAVPAFLPEILPAVEIGWRFARTSWGSGYATEAATAALAFAFGAAGLDRVVSIRHPDNARSARVMAKLGLHHDRDTVIPETGRPAVVEALTRAEYLSR